MCTCIYLNLSYNYNIASDLSSLRSDCFIADIINTIPSAECTYYEVDATNEQQVEQLFINIIQKYGKIDICVNNSGIYEGGFVLHLTSLKEFETVMNTNVTSMFLILQQCLSYMIKQRKTNPAADYVIINNASVDGLSGSPYSCAYVTSKHAVIGLTKN